MDTNSRILAIDFGQKRIGLAISDPLQITAQPLETLEYRNEQDIWVRLEGIVQKYLIESLIIGLPRNMNGSEGPAAQKAKSFADRCRRRFPGIQIVLWDERLSSRLAERTLHQAGKKPSRMKGTIDKMAALVLLQNYLDRNSFAASTGLDRTEI